MTKQDVIEEMQRIWKEIGADFFVDEDGHLDESVTMTGDDIQGYIGDFFIDRNAECREFFTELIKTEEGRKEWDAIKEEAFPSKSLYCY